MTDKETALAVEWLERRYSEWKFCQAGESNPSGLIYYAVEDPDAVSDFRVSRYTSPMFTFKSDLPHRLRADATDEEAEEHYECPLCSWHALLNRHSSHTCWNCGRRVRHMEGDLCSTCREDEAYD